MLFNSFSYLLFLPLVVGLYWVLPMRMRRLFLLLASYFFYMTWRPAYGLLILALTLVNYFFGLAIARTQTNPSTNGAGKAILTLGLVFNLAILCYFKYTNFLLESLFACLGLAVSITHASVPHDFSQPVLNIILPLGISFFTFEFIHYIVDVYRGSKPVKSFVDFALFASFFPSQIAGPIKRFQDFMHQLEEKPVFISHQFREGTFLILQGLFKKVVLGDNLSPIVAQGFILAGSLTWLDAVIAVIGFSYQLYFDFSGYTDIGRGSALLLGYKVPENFNLPFLAASLTDFWRRWHISLSTWLRDYLFISLGGSRRSPLITKRNLMLTMVLGGLWHGAAWHFVIWGAVHGLGLVVFKDWSQAIAAHPLTAKLQSGRLYHIAGIVFTNIFVFLAFAVFRASNLPQAILVIERFFGIGVTGLSGVVTSAALQSPLMVAIPTYFAFCLGRLWAERLGSLEQQSAAVSTSHFGGRLAYAYQNLLAFWESHLSARLVTYASVLTTIIAFAPSQFSPFIYFQF